MNHIPTQAAAAQQSATDRLRHIQDRVRSVQRGISFSEGRLLDFDSAEDLQRTLNSAMRDLEQLTLTVAVMQRKGGSNG